MPVVIFNKLQDLNYVKDHLFGNMSYNDITKAGWKISPLKRPDPNIIDVNKRHLFLINNESGKLSRKGIKSKSIEEVPANQDRREMLMNVSYLINNFQPPIRNQQGAKS